VTDDVDQFRARARSREAWIHHGCFYGGWLAFFATILSGVLPLLVLSGVLFVVSGKIAYDGANTHISYRRGPSVQELEDMSPTQKRQHAQRVGLRLIVFGVLIVLLGLFLTLHASQKPAKDGVASV